MSVVQGDVLKDCIMYALQQERIVWPLTPALAGTEVIYKLASSQAETFLFRFTGEEKIYHGKRMPAVHLHLPRTQCKVTLLC